MACPVMHYLTAVDSAAWLCIRQIQIKRFWPKIKLFHFQLLIHCGYLKASKCAYYHLEMRAKLRKKAKLGFLFSLKI
ncbi:hypothetical protein DB41_HF00090 [Neochlamydia sp. TUME1]|nr:hypothetical protein DB41_HF00090 [Neochlamydia sp. TUME1]